MSVEKIADDQTTTEPRESVVRVRTNLFKPLDQAGLRRPRGQTAAEHQAMRGHLESRLAYMDAGNLSALVAALERVAEGSARNRWPDEATVWNIARHIQQPPDRSDRLLTSYMASRAGVAAWERCPWEAVALARNLREFGPPKYDSTWDRIRDSGERLRRTHMRCAASADPEDVRAASKLDRERSHVKGLVFPVEIGGAT
ncbi:MAG: hypothetical protein AAFR79_20605 [Pseudomonadota bacterium]